MENFEVTVVNLNTKENQVLTIEVDEAETTEYIVIKVEISGRIVTASNENYLSAYQEFRDKMLDLGFGIKCNGSRINAVQSGMMGGTDKVYLVTFGQKALMKDVVNMFDYAEIDEFPDTKRQKEYFNQWIGSLKN